MHRCRMCIWPCRSRARLGEQCSLLVDDHSTDRDFAAERCCEANDLVVGDDVGKPSPVEFEQREQLSAPLGAPSSTAIDRLAVVASVTNAPVSWCRSQVSDVVTTPPVSTLRRSHAILGVEK